MLRVRVVTWTVGLFGAAMLYGALAGLVFSTIYNAVWNRSQPRPV